MKTSEENTQQRGEKREPSINWGVRGIQTRQKPRVSLNIHT